MARRKKKEPLDAEKLLDEFVRRVSSPKERESFRELLRDLVKNNSIPLELLREVPGKPEIVGKTRFDQLYDACMYLAFPGYRSETLDRLMTPERPDGTKIWRVMFPPKFRLSHVLLRAETYQQAFALACDYACRVLMKSERTIPNDLTIRVQFVSEKAIRRNLDIRWANRVKKRKQLQLVGREFTPKEINGARLVALGGPTRDPHSIFRYAEKKDLLRMRRKIGRARTSSVETETYRSK